MKIRSIETIPVALPLRRAHTWRGTATGLGAYLLTRVTTEDGLVGWGEAPTLITWGGDHGRYYGESQATAAIVIRDHLAPPLVGADPTQIAQVHELMDAAVAGHPYAKSALDLACYDLMGKAAGRPVSAFLGGAVRREIPLAHSFGLNMTPDQVEAEAECVLADGIRALKVKVGADLARDVEVVLRLRRAAAGIPITVDANQAWLDADAAIAAIARLDEFELAAVEQPVAGIRLLAEVRRRVRPPVMADESAWTAEDVRDIAAAGAADQVSIYYSKPGGLYRAMAVAAACTAHGIRANVNGSAETGVGNAANLQLAACALAADLPCVVMINAPKGQAPTRCAGRLYDDDLVAHPYVYRDGCLVVPDGPGLGIAVDEEKVTKYRIDR